MSNLTNVYANLRDKFLDVDMMLTKPTSYIKTLTKCDDQKIIFIFKEDRSKLLKSSSPLACSESERNSLNVTGSPLEDDNSIHEIMSKSIANDVFVQSIPWEAVEESYAPIPMNTAREILNNIANQKFPKTTFGWIFILCSDDQLPTENAIFMLSLYLNEGAFSRGIGSFHGIVLHESKVMKNLINRHKSMSAGIRSSPEIQIENIFELSPNITIKFINNLADEKSSLLTVEKFSEVMLYQKVLIENGSEICKELWEQICLLSAIQNDIVRFRSETGDGTLVEPTYTYGSMEYDRLQQRVNHILSDVVTINEGDMDNADTELEAVVKRAYNRPLTEVTDQLWELLKFSSSYSDLKRIITLIFQISSRSCIVNIPMNNNRMGELIRELSHQRLAIPHLTSTEPMELLLEIGLEKVLKDYEYIFSQSKICVLNDISIGEARTEKMDNRFSVRKSLASSSVDTGINRKTLLHGVRGSPDSIDDLDEIRNSRFKERASENAIAKLAQIHRTVEHLLLIQSHLNLEHDYAFIAKKILESPLIGFEELIKQKFDKLEFPIQDNNVLQLVNKLVPNAQKITMKSENKFKAVESVNYFNIEQIVPALVRKENEDEPVDKKGNSFHYLSFTNIVSKF